MFSLAIAVVVLTAPPVTLAALTQWTPRRRLGHRLHLGGRRLLLGMAGSAAWPGYAPPHPAAHPRGGLARRLISVLSDQPVSGTGEEEAFHVAHTEPVMQLPTDYADPNWGWIVHHRARRAEELAQQLTPLLWRLARVQGLDRDTARRLVLRVVADTALTHGGEQRLREELVRRVREEAAALRGETRPSAADEPSPAPLAAATTEHRDALTVLAYARREHAVRLLERLDVQAAPALEWLRSLDSTDRV